MAADRDTAADGHCVLLLHALGLDSGSWSPQLEGLGDNFSIFAPDLLGHGHAVHEDHVGFPEMCDDIERYVDSKGLERFAIVGCSMDSLVAIRLACALSGRVSCMVLGNAFAWTPPEHAAARLRARRKMLSDFGSEGPPVERQVAAVLTPHAPETSRRTLAASMARTPFADVVTIAEAVYAVDLRETCRGVTCPCLVLAGAEDPIAPLSSQRELADLLQRSDLVALDRAGHLAHLDQPQEYNRLVGSFIRDNA